jgi:hypothetical protein
MIRLLLSPIIGGPMFIFACIVGGLIVASTVFALFVASGPEVTLSDIARQMEKMHGSQPHNELRHGSVENKREARVYRSR